MSPADDGTVTMAAVARLAGVSSATVSRVLQGSAATSEGARRRVLAAVDELGYRRAARVPRAAPPTAPVGVWLASLADRHVPVVVGILTEASRHHRPVLPLLGDQLRDPLSTVVELLDRVAGFLVVGSSAPDTAISRLGSRTPVVVAARRPVPRCAGVAAEDRSTASQLTAHLLGHGRQRLVFVGDPDWSPEVAARHQGFRQAHAAANLPAPRPPLRVPAVEGAGRRVADELQRRRVRVDGLVCASDEVALGLLQGLADAGIVVPDDIAVVGWGDVPAAHHVRPTLTTVKVPSFEVGALAFRLLLDALPPAPDAREAAGSPAPVIQTQAQAVPRPRDEYVQLASEIVLRASCGCGEGHQR